MAEIILVIIVYFNPLFKCPGLILPGGTEH